MMSGKGDSVEGGSCQTGGGLNIDACNGGGAGSVEDWCIDGDGSRWQGGGWEKRGGGLDGM